MSMEVEIRQGRLTGKKGENCIKYLGIPYAEPPLGELRFRAPVKAKPWDGVYEATSFKKDPMQQDDKFGPEYFSEDCLYLNVWKPITEERKLPVMVWIPGGAFATGGSGAKDPNGPALYDLELMAKDSGCIIVSVSQRLNIYGFLHLSSFSERFEDNVGMKDLVCALEWVRDNIEAFGGDKDNVTLWGQSAGAGAISALLMIDEAEGLFHKIIMESNCFGSYYSPEEARYMALKFMELSGVDQKKPEGIMDLPYEKVNEALKELQDFIYSTENKEGNPGKCIFCPLVDGKYIKGYPTLSDFTGKGIPMLVGSNKDEGKFQVFIYKAGYGTSEEVIERLAKKFLRYLPETIQETLYRSYDLPKNKGMADLLTDGMYTVPKIWMTEKMMDNADVFVYRYDYEAPVMKIMGLGSSHIAEMAALFDIKVKPYSYFGMFDKKRLTEIGTRMRKYWGAFARTGRPDVPRQVEWKPYEKENRYTLIIDKNDRLESDPEKVARMKYEGVDRILV